VIISRRSGIVSATAELSKCRRGQHGRNFSPTPPVRAAAANAGSSRIWGLSVLPPAWSKMRREKRCRRAGAASAKPIPIARRIVLRLDVVEQVNGLR